MPEPVLTDMNPRLEACRREVEDNRSLYLAALKRRNRVIVAAVDHGMSQRAIARSAGLTPARVSALLLLPDDELDEAEG
ncbi:MAG: hypothetical protein BGO38_07840 [Cellulomonas sp. 73-145]|uniref:hypothetical protein n=1 Tax=Cellulomonas sp. 73-145 TaxID=1895739 RepID=UPI0009289690|nr:hypothetical protein [Cellulomonas sp. 73-145]MBN9327641.1 hypothetical protein [Cellulomonas sp.]OJV58103.1 MAG: hypothetical protein BGO38_07840 [Cellulomonas sp. 73-145]